MQVIFDPYTIENSMKTRYLMFKTDQLYCFCKYTLVEFQPATQEVRQHPKFLEVGSHQNWAQVNLSELVLKLVLLVSLNV